MPAGCRVRSDPTSANHDITDQAGLTRSLQPRPAHKAAARRLDGLLADTGPLCAATRDLQAPTCASPMPSRASPPWFAQNRWPQ
eukprot:3527780-Pyramimonas_sp.AAC.2